MTETDVRTKAKKRKVLSDKRSSGVGGGEAIRASLHSYTTPVNILGK